MQEKLARLKQLWQEIHDLRVGVALMEWDQQVNMPHGGAEDRSDAVSTLSSVIHEKQTSEELVRLNEELAPYGEQLDPNSDDACLIRVSNRIISKKSRVPAEFIKEFTRLTALSQNVWEKAKADNNFAIFRPYLEQIVEMKKQYAALFKPYDHVYDPLLDDFEPGLKTADVKAIFDELRPQQVDLIHRISEKPQVRDDFLHVAYPESGQWDFGVDAVTHCGYDWNRGRQDKAVHPFTISFGIDDVRITTKFIPKMPSSALFSTIHEGGHAMYEQGVSKNLRRLPLATEISMSLHESQSRMWENVVGRSHAFWEYFYPRMKKLFPTQLDGVDLETFYRGINKVEPSFIRTESDEATYNLHIMLRLELEIALMEGKLAVKDLPAAWNERMKGYLGVQPPTDSLGVLQDVHWSSGYIGYFPTYALGNLVSAQWWEIVQKEIPDIEKQFSQGKFDQLLDWLRKNIHVHGGKFEAQKLVQEVTGSKISPQPYMRYLTEKFERIYNL